MNTLAIKKLDLKMLKMAVIVAGPLLNENVCKWLKQVQ